MTNSLKDPPDKKLFRAKDQNDNFGLTKVEFDRFVQEVKAGDETLFIKVFNAQIKSSVRFLKNKFSISEGTAYDTCMDTLLEFRIKLKADKISYGNLRFLFTRMAVNNYLDEIKRSKKISSAIETFMGESYDVKMISSEFLQLLEQSIEKLEKRQRHIIREIFYSGKSIDQILDENDITAAAFRKRKQRALEKLRFTFLELLKKSELS